MYVSHVAVVASLRSEIASWKQAFEKKSQELTEARKRRLQPSSEEGVGVKKSSSTSATFSPSQDESGAGFGSGSVMKEDSRGVPGDDVVVATLKDDNRRLAYEVDYLNELMLIVSQLL